MLKLNAAVVILLCACTLLSAKVAVVKSIAEYCIAILLYAEC